MTKLKQAARQALEALEQYQFDYCWDSKVNAIITALRDALAEPVSQEPVGYFAYDEEQQCWDQVIGKNSDDAVALYAAPVRTKDLTVSELDAIIEKHYDDEMDLKAMILDGIAADREKNK